jgi:hypothetical protein
LSPTDQTGGVPPAALATGVKAAGTANIAKTAKHTTTLTNLLFILPPSSVLESFKTIVALVDPALNGLRERCVVAFAVLRDSPIFSPMQLSFQLNRTRLYSRRRYTSFVPPVSLKESKWEQ